MPGSSSTTRTDACASHGPNSGSPLGCTIRRAGSARTAFPRSADFYFEQVRLGADVTATHRRDDKPENRIKTFPDESLRLKAKAIVATAVRYVPRQAISPSVAAGMALPALPAPALPRRTMP